MSTTYTIDATLNAKYTPQNMLCILQEGSKANFLYYQTISHKAPISDLEKALDVLLATDPNSGDSFINIVFQETDFFISFFKSDDEKLKVSIMAFGAPWRADFRDNIRMVNLARYIRLLLQLCKDFIVLELKTDDI
jgi:hypothetical protein